MSTLEKPILKYDLHHLNEHCSFTNCTHFSHATLEKHTLIVRERKTVTCQKHFHINNIKLWFLVKCCGESCNPLENKTLNNFQFQFS